MNTQTVHVEQQSKPRKFVLRKMNGNIDMMFTGEDTKF